MADDVTLNPGTNGSVIATDEISGVHFQKVKVTLGADDYDGGPVAAGNPMPSKMLVGTTAVSASAPMPIEAAGDSRDGITNAMTVIDYAHHEIHSGSMYSVYIAQSALGAAGVITYYLKTPDSTKRIHLFAEYETEVEATVDIFEDCESAGGGGDPGGGAAVTAKNHNRNSANTTDMQTLSLGVPGGTPHTFTAGTDIWSERFGAGRGAGVGGRNTHEFVLKSNSNHIIRLTNNNTSASWCWLSLSWYEHTDVA
jgi:hypothetical protein